MNKINPKILIIGAGASGIAAATKLYENGFRNLIILEAENRIGGRLYTIPFASNVVDLGAQWCHGEKDNVVYQMAHKFNTFSSATTKYNDFEYRNSNGEIVNREKGDRLTQLAISLVECYKQELKDYTGSLGHFIVTKFRDILSSDAKYKDIEPELAQQFLDFFHKYENSIEASDTWFDTSAEGYLHYWDCEGDRLLNWKDRGYSIILDIMMKKYPDPSKSLQIEDKIFLNKSVQRIDWDKGTDVMVEVRCNDGTVYDADHVIVTVSLGVLKERHLEMFNPPLPALKRRAIEGLTLGSVDKIFLEFSEPFWPKDWLGFSLLWNKDDLETLRHEQPTWLSDVFGFYVVDFQPNILCGWISGANARRMENASNEEITKGMMYLLNKFIKVWQIPQPIRVLNSSWYSNPNFRGSYTYRSITTDLLKTGSEDLAFPLTNSVGVPVLQFAGEASHEHYYSTVHGAVETGWREAKRIMDLYKNGPIDLSISSLESFKLASVPHVNVLILGAGLAGFGAAITLAKSNLSLMILEGQSMPGGRVNTVKLKSYKKSIYTESDTVEAGAQWLHGRRNELFYFCEEHKLLTDVQSVEGLGYFIREDGVIFDEFLVKKVDFIVGEILEECEKFAQSTDEAPASVDQFLREKFDNFLNTIENPEEKVQARQLLDWHVRFQVIDNSCLSLNELSTKCWGDYCFNGEDGQAHINFKSSGFNQAIDRMINEIGRDKIICNKEVIKIDWIDEKCQIQCSDESFFSADHVIITFSLGVLKNWNFFPGHLKLPNKYLKTINDIGYETINKIFLQFDHPWWGKNTKGIQLIWNNDNQSYETEGWIRHLTGFDLLSPGPSNTILGWVGGHGCHEMEKISDLDIVDDCIATLEKFVGHKIPKPIKYYCTRWHSNPFIRGAYAYPSTKLDKNETTKNFLLRPITKKDFNFARDDEHSSADYPIIFFAGEAYHDKYFSTAHGAFLTGIEQASKILDYSTKSKKTKSKL